MVKPWAIARAPDDSPVKRCGTHRRHQLSTPHPRDAIHACVAQSRRLRSASARSARRNGRRSIGPIRLPFRPVDPFAGTSRKPPRCLRETSIRQTVATIPRSPSNRRLRLVRAGACRALRRCRSEWGLDSISESRLKDSKGGLMLHGLKNNEELEESLT